MVRCIEDGYLQGLIADEAYKIHQEVESGERPVVGVNKFVETEPSPLTAGEGAIMVVPEGVEAEQIARLSGRWVGCPTRPTCRVPS